MLARENALCSVMVGLRRGLAASCAAAVVVLAMPVWAASEGVVEATGEAQVRGGDQVTAKKAAVADALRRAIEQVVGFTVQSDFSAQQQETVKSNQTEFYSQVKDKLVQRSEGFIQKYDVLEERRDGDVLKVKIRAHVFESKIRAEVKQLADLIAAAGNPKLMLVIQEVYVGTDGKSRLASQSVVSSLLEKELLARGFELRGQGEAKQLAAAAESESAWFQRLEGAAAMAREAGADIVIAGRIEVREKGPIEDTGGLDALKGQMRVELAAVVRGMNAATGEVFSSKPVQMASMGLNTERAVYRAVQGRGANVVKQVFDDLLADLKTSFGKTAQQGQSYVVQLVNVKSFRAQGRIFLDVLQGVTGVSSVKQKSFSDGVLTIDVACKCTASELQNHIFNAVDGKNGLSTLDVDGVSGARLSFKL